MSFEEEDTTEQHERRITRCRSCRAFIVWLPTEAGRAMPVDADTVKPTDETFEAKGTHVSHFASCPNAAKHRKPRPPQGSLL
jgi:hypothetical protein